LTRVYNAVVVKLFIIMYKSFLPFSQYIYFFSR